VRVSQKKNEKKEGESESRKRQKKETDKWRQSRDRKSKTDIERNRERNKLESVRDRLQLMKNIIIILVFKNNVIKILAWQP